jgi:adenosylcobyric acid synthase
MLGRETAPLGTQSLRVAVLRLPRISNATDFDPLAAEPGVQVRFATQPGDLADVDLIILPGSKSTVADLGWLRQHGFVTAIEEHVRAGRPLFGVCGGFQMLAGHIHDTVESKQGTVAGLGLLPVEITFGRDKILAWSHGSALDGVPVHGYQIRHGYVSNRAPDSEPLIIGEDGASEGVRAGNVLGTHWHGVFENDQFRRAFLSDMAQLAGRSGFTVSANTDFARFRERMLDSLGDLVAHHLDTTRLRELIDNGAPETVPVISTHLVPGQP